MQTRLTDLELVKTIGDVRAHLLDLRDLAKDGEPVCPGCLTEQARRLAVVLAGLPLFELAPPVDLESARNAAISNDVRRMTEALEEIGRLRRLLRAHGIDDDA
jgi:hypothetical protein